MSRQKRRTAVGGLVLLTAGCTSWLAAPAYAGDTAGVTKAQVEAAERQAVGDRPNKAQIERDEGRGATGRADGSGPRSGLFNAPAAPAEGTGAAAWQLLASAVLGAGAGAGALVIAGQSRRRPRGPAAA